ncbi:MAG: flavodoxin domain-containing protein [Candidatus Hermodarchaeota archaeon]
MTQRVLVGYGSRYGSTAEVAQEMRNVLQELGAHVDLVNLRKDTPPGDLQSYDLVVLGSGIQAGRWTKEPLQFIKKNLDGLSRIKVALFVVSGYAANPENHETVQSEYLDKIVEENPGLNPVATAFFAGVFDFAKYNFAVRRLIKSIVKNQIGPDEEVPEKIDSRDWDQIRGWTAGLLE